METIRKTRARVRRVRIHFCDGGDNCTDPRHQAYRRLMDALEEVTAATEAIREQDPPPADRRKGWHFGEDATHQLILDELAGLEWILQHFTASVYSALYPCSQSRKQAERDRLLYERDIAQVAGEPEEAGCTCRDATV